MKKRPPNGCPRNISMDLEIDLKMSLFEISFFIKKNEFSYFYKGKQSNAELRHVEGLAILN